MFSVLFWLIGIGAGVWWWLDCPPLPVALRELQGRLRALRSLSQKKRSNKKVGKSKNSAAEVCIDSIRHDPDGYTKSLYDVQIPLKVKQPVGGGSVPLIDHAKIKQNLIAGLNRQRRYSNLQS